MCANLVHIFRQRRDYHLLTQILRIVVTFNPSLEFLLMYAQVCLLHLGSADEALHAIQEELKVARGRCSPFDSSECSEFLKQGLLIFRFWMFRVSPLRFPLIAQISILIRVSHCNGLSSNSHRVSDGIEY
jgi:hypothetical protein